MCESEGKTLREAVVFAGTTEGRHLSEYLAKRGIAHTVCVATEYGGIVLKPHPLVRVHQGRMDEKQIETFLEQEKFAAVVDATHPFAKEITENIRTALKSRNKAGNFVPYFRLKREGIAAREDDLTYFETNEACSRALENTKGNILLTTGSKELAAYCTAEIKDRLYVRVLPSVESLSVCNMQGIYGKQILAMQGPFTREMNEAMLRQYQISYLVTKESGSTGGYREKIEAARRTGVQVFVIACECGETGEAPAEIGAALEEICGCADLPGEQDKTLGGDIEAHRPNMEIILAGAGMGSKDCLTEEVKRAIDEADLLFGAKRVLLSLCPKSKKDGVYPFYQAERIIPHLRGAQCKKAVILFSGDSGFYSGCSSIYDALQKEMEGGRLCARLRVLPGISSVAYLASCIGESYQDADIYSLHGKQVSNLLHRIKNSPKTFLITSGVKDINRLGEQLVKAGMTSCEIITGYRLSYEEQRVARHTPQECIELREEGLYTCLVKNPYAASRKLTHGIADGNFIRDAVPMTKEEVREVSICKMRLTEGAVVYDIGSGTGSVAVEIAGLLADTKVYAIEQKQDAASLIERNKEKFGLGNLTVVRAAAPKGLSKLPAATHAFIGGSGGRLKEILRALEKINPKMRIVINAVSLETIREIEEILEGKAKIKIKGEEIVQLQVSRGRKLGGYHLMQAENPVYVFSFDFGEVMRE